MKAVVAGSSVPGLALQLARSIGAEFIGVSAGRFPDGELHITIEKPGLPEKVCYVQTMAPLPNERLTELLLTCDLLRELGVREIVAIIPYLGYTRQDYRRAPGEAVSVATLFKLFESVGIRLVLSVDLHLHRLSIRDLEGYSGVKVREASAMRMLAERCPYEEPLVLAPDSEALRWAEAAAESLGAEYAAMSKKRVSPTEVELSFGGLDVEGRDVLLVDDIVSTGGTMIETARLLKKKGVRRICAAFTHAVFSSTECVANMFNAGIEELLSTNTVQNEFAVVDVSGLLRELL